MAHLTDRQKARLAKLGQLKEQYDDNVSKAEYRLAAEKEVYKAAIKAEVNAAFGEGIPKRQVHLALGFAQMNSLTNFLDDKRERAADKLNRILGNTETQAQILASIEPMEAQLVLVQRIEGKAVWDATFPDGEEYMVHIIPEGGGHFYVDNPNQTVPVEKMRELFEYGLKNNKHWEFDDFGLTYEEE